MSISVLFRQESYAVVGACYAVYRQLGCGFLEAVYQESLEIELRQRAIPFVAREPRVLEYRGCLLRAHYAPDLICYGRIIVEIKAVAELADEHRAQLINYLKATRLTLGLLVNFGHYPKAQVQRIVAERGRFAPDR